MKLLSKMKTEWKELVQYTIPLEGCDLYLNPYVGQKISFRFTGKIHCIACDVSIKKTFNTGYCWSCFNKLPQCDMCIMKPELCHYMNGTCRESEWGEKHCLIPHTVYLANTSDIKVGITRAHQQMTRWMDQGATQAYPFATVNNRYQSGRLEVLLKSKVADKTNWRKMLQGNGEAMDLLAKREELLPLWPNEIEGSFNENTSLVEIKYPVLEFPQKIKSFNLDKDPKVEGTLLGIKGQYLLFDTGVINLRKYQGYSLDFSL